jgi:hypothetical protein
MCQKEQYWHFRHLFEDFLGMGVLMELLFSFALSGFVGMSTHFFFPRAQLIFEASQFKTEFYTHPTPIVPDRFF